MGVGPVPARPSAMPALLIPDVLRSSGQPLAGPLREEMEARLRGDFSPVRVHTDAIARASAAEVGARAYTSGSHIVIGDSAADKHTLAHELTHVMQQRQGPVAGTDHGGGVRVSDPSDVYEKAAEANAARVMRAPMLRQPGHQQTVGDRAVLPVPHTRAATASRPWAGAPAAPVIQRAIIPHAAVPGLTRDLDTSDLATSQVQVMNLWNGGKVQSLRQLLNALAVASPEDSRLNNWRLRFDIQVLLAKPAWWDPNAGIAGDAEREAFDQAHPAGDQTGIVSVPGQGETLPAHPTPRQTAAINVRSWQIGDIVDGVSWLTLGAHLQGRMTQQDYIDLGDGILRRRDLRDHTNIQPTATDADKEQVARASLTRVSNEIHVGLNDLPKTPGISYRAATSAPGVYGNLINVNDYVKDMAFWSTSGLRLSHRADDFGSEGTVAQPKVYYLIEGSTGVFLPQFTNKETGVREILFNAQTIFWVRKITNYADRTFFVYVREKDPLVAPLAPVTKNPWSGAVNP